MAAVSTEFHDFIASPVQSKAGPGLFTRMLRRIQDAQMHAAEREVARFIAMRGGRMTDGLEREIERHFV